MRRGKSGESEKNLTEQDLLNSHEKRGEGSYLKQGREKKKKEGVLPGGFYRDGLKRGQPENDK